MEALQAECRELVVTCCHTVEPAMSIDAPLTWPRQPDQADGTQWRRPTCSRRGRKPVWARPSSRELARLGVALHADHAHAGQMRIEPTELQYRRLQEVGVVSFLSGAARRESGTATLPPSSRAFVFVYE